MGKWPIFDLLFVGWLGSHHRLKYSLLCCTQHFKVIKTYVYCHFVGVEHQFVHWVSGCQCIIYNG